MKHEEFIDKVADQLIARYDGTPEPYLEDDEMNARLQRDVEEYEAMQVANELYSRGREEVAETFLEACIISGVVKPRDS